MMPETEASQTRPQGLRLPPAYRLRAFDELDSTNAEARRQAEAGAEDGTLIWARRQTAGRGRRGRDWESPEGNLYISLVLRPDCALDEAAQLGFVAALAVGDAVGSVGPPMIEVRYKWPNDVLLNDRKAAGILLESQLAPDGALQWLVLGIGVNLRDFPTETDFPATSLRFEGAPTTLTVEVLLESFARHFMAWVNRWLEDGFAPIRKAWLQHAYGLGETITANLPRESVTGRFRDIDSDGTLLLEEEGGGLRRITAGDVYFGG